jgi:thioredoxin reductase/NAD-dependent dihydropyrimidine dehydrogenase PreA subunit
VHDSLPLLLSGLSALGVIVAALVVALRRADLRTTASSLAEREDARVRGSHDARLQHPEVDLDLCIGCGACVAACPEEGVLAMAHGQAVVVHGARCVGHGRCADACPVGAVAVTLGDVSMRDDLPAVSDDLEAVGVPGLFIAGELGGYALVRTAIAQGTVVADVVAQRVPRRQPGRSPAGSTKRRPAVAGSRAASARPATTGGSVAVLDAASDGPLDLLVVGAGPAGLACALRSREIGVSCAIIDQEAMVGGAVAQYPRAKLVMTQPVHLPLHGKLPKLSYQKEELIELWEDVVTRHRLDVRTSTRMLGVHADPEGGFTVETSRGPIRARNVCLALGRRGTPRKLGVPGEDWAKVHYSLIDAQSWRNCELLVVGGGDSAIEAAIGLASQPGNNVTLSYRKHAFFRLKARNDRAIREAEASGALTVLYQSEVRAVHSNAVDLTVARADGTTEELSIANDAVFVFAGGTPPFGLLKDAGVSFDPADRPGSAEGPQVDRGTGLLTALLFASGVALAVLAFVLWRQDYYGLSLHERATSDWHEWLQPKGPLGLWFGLVAVALFSSNLAYLLRRNRRIGRWVPGSLRAWMSVHVFTGLAAFFCVTVHAAFAPRDTVGGHAFLAMAVVVVTGTIGRYLYAFVPRATNGKELEIDQLRGRIAAMSGEWDRDGRGFGARVRSVVEELVERDRAAWNRGLIARVFAIVRSRIALRSAFAELRREGVEEGVPVDEVRSMLALARRAHGLMLASAHYAEVRSILGSWRYLHRWLALLLVLLTVLHVVTALRYGGVDWSNVLPGLGGGR